MNFFESMRRANTDFYTANPVEFLSAEQLQELAHQQEMTVAELKAHLTTPRIESTCLLCGQASTHLVSCTGCRNASDCHLACDPLAWRIG